MPGQARPASDFDTLFYAESGRVACLTACKGNEGWLLVDVVWFILIGPSAGWLAGQIMVTGDHGLVGNLIVGVIGAPIGGLIFRTVGIAVGSGLLGSLIVATVGAITLIAALRLLRRL